MINKFINKYHGLNDIFSSVKRIDVIIHLAITDLRARYKNSVLGPLWISLGTGIFIFGLAFLWSELFHKDVRSFIPSLSIGLILWYFISSCITDSTTILINKSMIIKNLKIPIFMFPFQVLIKQFFNLLHNLIIFIIIFFIFDMDANINLIYAPLTFILFFINMLWISLLLSILGARFRDLSFVISSVLPLLFFMTPVLYRADDLNILKSILWLNPFSHFIEIIRAPLMGMPVQIESVFYSIAFMVLGWTLTIFLFNKIRNKIIFWI